MKSLGVLSFALFGAGVAFMLRRWPGDAAKTYSQNAAREQSSILYYGALVVAFLALLSLFTYGWMVPTLHLPVGFVILFGIGVFAQAVCAIVPETEGSMVLIHRTAATVMYFSSVALVGVLAGSLHALAAALLVWLAFVLMAATVGLALIWNRAQRHAILFQTIHVIILATAFMFATYIS